MEAFSLLRFWRGGGGGGGVTIDGGAHVRTTATNAAGSITIVSEVSENTTETDEDADDDGPFFDLEFAVPDEDEAVKNEDDCSNLADNGDEDRDDGDGDESDVTEEREFKFTLSSGSSTDPNVSISPSDDLFFNGSLVPIEPPSVVFNGSDSSDQHQNSKSQFPVSLLKSATKFRVLMLKFKKSKSNAEPDGSESEISKPESETQSQKQSENQTQSKLFTVKLKVEEVPIVSLFTRDNSSRSKPQPKQSSDESAVAAAASDEKRFSKDVMQRYLKMVKPLYIRVSKRYGDKLRFSGQLSLGSLGVAKAEPAPPSTAVPESLPSKTEPEQPEVADTPPPPPLPPSNVKSQKQVNLQAGLRVVCKHLGKSRSASSAVAAAPAPAGPMTSKRRDDSLLQQQDGIQSAILHCKRSFNASRDSESTILSRSVSNPSYEKSIKASTKSTSGEAKAEK